MADGQQTATKEPTIEELERAANAANTEAPDTGFLPSLRSAMGMNPRGGLADDINDLGAGLKRLAVHPLDSARLLGEGLLGGQQDVANRGMERMRRPGIGNKIEGAVQYAESGIPLAGPLLSRAGEQAESGDILGMAGTMTPLAVSAYRPGGLEPLRSSIAESTRTPANALTSGTRNLSRLGGYAAGRGLSGNWEGGVVGAGVGPTLADALLPKRTPRPSMSPDLFPSLEEPTPSGGGGGGIPQGRLSLLPEPRPAPSGYKPGAMWSVARQEELEPAARSGAPGAGDVLTNIRPGRYLYEPRGGTGYPGPRDPLQGRETLFDASQGVRTSQVERGSQIAPESQGGGIPEEPRKLGSTLLQKMAEKGKAPTESWADRIFGPLPRRWLR